jgi:hypothetical protein
MSWNPNTNKHKAQHGGYKGRPTRSEVNALLNLYGGIHAIVVGESQVNDKKVAKPVKKEIGNQLSFDF